MEKYNEENDTFENYEDNYNTTEQYNSQEAYAELEDKWYEIEDEYRARYLAITDQDVDFEPGHFDRTLDRIARRMDKSRSEIRTEIENW